MADFVIQCPDCGNSVRATSGIFVGRFVKKDVKCSCGRKINVQANRMATKTCPHCKNTVVFDAAKEAKCPVCKAPLNADSTNTVDFACEQCGVRLWADPDQGSEYTCPVCGKVNDVQKQIGKERILREGVASIIKYEGDNKTLIWKHPIEDFAMGSQLIVHESQEAVFFRDGQALDSLGPGRHTLETQSVPILGKLYKLPTDTTKTFHSEIYYINLTTQMGIKWGTDTKVRVKDPVNGFYVELGAGGEFSLKVTDARRLLLKLVGTEGGLSQADLLSTESVAGVTRQTGYFRAMIMTNVKTYLAQTIRQENINVLDIDMELTRLSEGLRTLINQSLADYGLMMPEFYVTRIVTPDDDENFIRLQQQFADRVLNVREKQIQREVTEADIELEQAKGQRELLKKQIEAQSTIIGAQADAEVIRQRARAEAEEMKLKGYTYQQETARQVGINATSNIGGGEGSGGGLGGLMGLGVAMGAMGSIAGTTRNAVSGILDAGMEPADGWSCGCGTYNTGKFCSACGKPRPQADAGWTCGCGTVNTGKFCSECGRPKPEEPEKWTCSCGAVNLGKFCGECGRPKPDGPWDCACGNTGITGKFCPECGRKKGE